MGAPLAFSGERSSFGVTICSGCPFLSYFLDCQAKPKTVYNFPLASRIPLHLAVNDVAITVQ